MSFSSRQRMSLLQAKILHEVSMTYDGPMYIAGASSCSHLYSRRKYESENLAIDRPMLIFRGEVWKMRTFLRKPNELRIDRITWRKMLPHVWTFIPERYPDRRNIADRAQQAISQNIPVTKRGQTVDPAKKKSLSKKGNNWGTWSLKREWNRIWKNHWCKKLSYAIKT